MSEELKIAPPSSISYLVAQSLLAAQPLDWQDDFKKWSFATSYVGNVDVKNHRRDTAYKFYTTQQIPELVTAITKAKQEENRTRARFVLRDLTPENPENLVFAPEGDRDDTTPGHIDMAAKAVSAGTVFLNADQKINAIDHKSGAFRARFESLVPVLAILKENALLAETVTLKRLHCNGSLRDETVVATSQLLSWSELAPTIPQNELVNSTDSPHRKSHTRTNPPSALLERSKKKSQQDLPSTTTHTLPNVDLRSVKVRSRCKGLFADSSSLPKNTTHLGKHSRATADALIPSVKRIFTQLTFFNQKEDNSLTSKGEEVVTDAIAKAAVETPYSIMASS